MLLKLSHLFIFYEAAGKSKIQRAAHAFLRESDGLNILVNSRTRE